MTPSLTVLMAVYNGEAFLEASVRSILQQSHGDFRFLVIDDASTDATGSLLLKVSDPRLEVVRLSKNVGQTAALNLGFRRAATPWIARMDADDVSARDRLARQMEAVCQNPALDCVGTGVWEFQTDPQKPEAVIIRPQNHEEIWEAELLGNGLIHGSLLLRREAVLSLGGYNEAYRYASDRELFLRFLRSFKAMNLPKPLVGLRRHGAQDSFSIQAAQEYLRVYREAIARGGFKPWETARLKRSLAYSFLFRAQCRWQRREPLGVLQDWGKALGTSAPTALRHGLGKLAKRSPLPERFLEPFREKRLGTRRHSSPTGRLKDLLSLAEVLEEIRRRFPDPAVEAIDWLHLKHPLTLKQKALLREDGTPRHPRGRPLWVFQAAALFGYAFYLTGRLAQMKLAHGAALRGLRRKPFDLVLKTWRFHPDGMPGQEDFYFGDLGSRLQRAGVGVLRLFGNPAGRPWEGPCRRAASNVAELPEWCLIPLTAPFGFAWKAWRASVRVRAGAAAETDPWVRRCLEQAQADCLRPEFLPVALYAALGEEIAKTWHPRMLLTLYEGHAWEKCLWSGFRRKAEGAQVAGYQHTVLLPHQMELLKPSVSASSNGKPDLVLCLGERTSRMLAPSHPEASRISFGTFRQLPDGKQGVASPERRTVLVLPEGHRDEALLLFSCALEAARVLTDHRFLLRSHPVLPFKKVRGALKAEGLRLPNVEISSSERIEEDFKRSSVVLYRGSSAVMYAVTYGLKPIYLHQEGQEVLDPLFELVPWRERVDSPGLFGERLRAHAAAGLSGQVRDEWAQAQAYVKDYLAPVTPDSIHRLMETVGKEDAFPCTV